MRTEEELGGTIPKGDNSVGVRNFESVVKEPGQPKVRQLEDAFVVNEKVGAFDIAVENVLLVTEEQSFEQLFHVAFDLSLGEVVGIGRVHQAREVVIHVLEDKVNASFSFVVVFGSHDLFQSDDVLMPQFL